jgi:flavin-dependent dehydrogenase
LKVERSTDVVVIGGGPAGSTVASFLARRGWGVTVFERAVFPRDHVGESLLPFCYEIFDELGVLEEMERRYSRKPGVRFLDTDGETFTSYCFGNKVDGPKHLSFHVLRADFDELLLDHAVEEGAMVHEGVAVRGVDTDGPDGRASVTVEDGDGNRATIDCRFVIDASGRDTFLANRRKSKAAHKELERTALSSHWSGAAYTGGLEEGMIQIVYTGGEKQGWIWVIPIGSDRLSIGSVMNTAYYLDRRRALVAEFPDDWQQQLYLQEIRSAAFVDEILGAAEQMMPVLYNGDYSYICNEKWGDNFALVGDASAFIDPIFSSGVYLAMQSGRHLARAVDHRLRDGIEASTPIFADTYGKIVGAYELVDKLIRVFYTPDALNFAQFGSASATFTEHEHYENAMSFQHFLLAGDFFEEAGKYSAFVDTMTDPRRFDQYKNLVIDREEFQVERTCGVPFDTAYPEGLRAMEKVWLARGI